jgi:2-aminoethylphosphonate-pyruvate transaminase
LRLLLALAGAEDTHVCVPLQGSGTFCVEATIGTLVPPEGKLLILVNGAYGRRMARICEYYGRAHATIDTPEDVPNDPAALDQALADDPTITHVAAVHCETTSGILNPIEQIAAVSARHGRGLIIDAMSALGAIELDARKVVFDAVAASSNKCLEGVPGMGFAIIRRDALQRCQGNAPSLSLDLYDQWVGSGASHRRPMLSSPSTRHSTSTRPKAAWPAAAHATATTARSWYRACASWAS